MAIREAKLKDGIEAVAIVTPNHVHYEAAKEFLKRGIHVICDKPLTSTLSDAKKLKKAADDSDALFVLTHNYTGYPMVRQAREMVQNGDIGAVRLVQMEYPQDWLTENIEQSGQKQAAWRTDPARSAPAARPATSAPTPTISAPSSPGWSSRNWPPISTVLSKDASSTTTPM